MASVMARHNKFVPPNEETPGMTDAYSYGFHFDASLYAAYLRDYAVTRGAQRIEGMIVEVEQHPKAASSRRQAARRPPHRRRPVHRLLGLPWPADRRRAQGRLRGLEQLPAVQQRIGGAVRLGAATDALHPFHRQEAGWLWRIPLQHRIGNGHVYSNNFTSDEQARRVLLDGLDGAALDEPRQIRFVTGRRRKSWDKNVVAIGLSAGFIEPLESTSINLIETAVGKLLELFPDRDCSPALADEFNRFMGIRYESVRDFIVLHYKLTQRDDSEFWRYCASMPIPDALRHQIELFRETGRVAILDRAGFAEPSLWP
jgi:tryptophan halogenase